MAHRSRAVLSTRHGQSMVEYLAVAIAVIGAIFAVKGSLEAKANGLMGQVQNQLMSSGGTADGLLR